MCIIPIKPQGKKMFPDSTITTMFINNPDGAGYMYYDKKHKCVQIKKGFMTCASLLASLKAQDLTNTNVVLHFRIGTSGKNDKMNCHPYPVFDDNATKCKTKLAMAHNGILHDYEPPKGATYNDTQNFIKKVLSKLDKHFLTDKNAVLLIDQLIGTNKLAFLDDKNVLTTIGHFIKDDGYIYSNSTYKMSSLYPRGFKGYSSYCDDYYNTYFPTKVAKPVTTKVCPEKTDAKKCVSKKFKLTDDEKDLYYDDVNGFWDWWDKKHPIDTYSY